jgi:C-terminal processing protease CtpA/Prc
LVLAAEPGGPVTITGLSSNSSPDAKGGVHVGDKPLAVDDVPVTGKPLAAAALQLQGKAGTVKRLRLECDGQSITVHATVKAPL